MRKIIFLIFLPVLLFGQVRTDYTVAFNADSISTELELPKHFFLTGVFCPDSLTAAFTFLVSDEQSSESWFSLDSAGSDYSVAIDSTADQVVIFDFDIMRSARKLKLLIDNDPPDTVTVRAIMNKYP